MPSAIEAALVGTVGTEWVPQWVPHLSLIYRTFSYSTHSTHSSFTFPESPGATPSNDVKSTGMGGWRHSLLSRNPVGTVGTVGTAVDKPYRYRKYSPFCGTHCGTHLLPAGGYRRAKGGR